MAQAAVGSNNAQQRQSWGAEPDAGALLVQVDDDDIDLAGDKQMVETQYLMPERAGEAEQRFSQIHNRLIDDENTSEGFKTALTDN